MIPINRIMLIAHNILYDKHVIMISSDFSFSHSKNNSSHSENIYTYYNKAVLQAYTRNIII